MRAVPWFDLVVKLMLIALCFAGFGAAAGVIWVSVTGVRVVIAALTGKQRNEGMD